MVGETPKVSGLSGGGDDGTLRRCGLPRSGESGLLADHTAAGFNRVLSERSEPVAHHVLASFAVSHAVLHLADDLPSSRLGLHSGVAGRLGATESVAVPCGFTV